MRLVYRQSLIEMLLFGAIVLQIGSGAALVWQGKTTMDEVLRVTREG